MFLFGIFLAEAQAEIWEYVRGNPGGQLGGGPGGGAGGNLGGGRNLGGGVKQFCCRRKTRRMLGRKPRRTRFSGQAET